MVGYPVIVEQADDGGYGAWSPDLPGLRRARRHHRGVPGGLYLDVLREPGDEVPLPRAIQAITLPAA